MSCCLDAVIWVERAPSVFCVGTHRCPQPECPGATAQAALTSSLLYPQTPVVLLIIASSLLCRGCHSCCSCPCHTHPARGPHSCGVIAGRERGLLSNAEPPRGSVHSFSGRALRPGHFTGGEIEAHVTRGNQCSVVTTGDPKT